MDSFIIYVICLLAASIINANEVYEWKVFWEAWKQSNSPNFVVSPFSLYAVLGTLALSSKNYTHNQILDALGAHDIFDVLMTYSNYLDDLKNVHGVVVADKLYVTIDAMLIPAVQNITKRSFNLEIENIDFNNPFAANKINKWVKRVSKNRIKHIVAPELLPGSSILPVSAIYFDGKLKGQVGSGFRGDFHVNEQTTIEVDYTVVKGDLLYVRDEYSDVQALSFPYQEDDCNLMVVFPDGYYDVNSYYFKYAFQRPFFIKDLTMRMKSTHMSVNLPLFQIETKTVLGQLFRNMNVSDVLSEYYADLTKMTYGNPYLYVTEGYQITSIKIEDDGDLLEGYDIANAGRESSINIIVDKPFYYEYRCKRTLLFNGIVSQP